MERSIDNLDRSIDQLRRAELALAMADLPMISFLARPTVLKLAGFEKTTLYKKMAAGDFPLPVEISEGRRAWPDIWLKKWGYDLIEKAGNDQARMKDETPHKQIKARGKQKPKP